MKARLVKGLHPEAPLADAAEQIVRVRLDELYLFVPRALDPAEVQTLHDLRIAAKRLRYVLEVTAPCFGPYATTAAKRAKRLQDVIGEVHDCDVMLPRVEAQLEALRAADVAALREAAGDAGALEARHVAWAPNRGAYRGLELLGVHLRARRELEFERFLELWRRLEQERFRAQLERALGERPRPEPTVAPPAPRRVREMFSSRSRDLHRHS